MYFRARLRYVSVPNLKCLFIPRFLLASVILPSIRTLGSDVTSLSTSPASPCIALGILASPRVPTPSGRTTLRLSVLIRVISTLLQTSRPNIPIHVIIQCLVCFYFLQHHGNLDRRLAKLLRISLVSLAQLQPSLDLFCGRYWVDSLQLELSNWPIMHGLPSTFWPYHLLSTFSMYVRFKYVESHMHSMYQGFPRNPIQLFLPFIIQLSFILG